MGLFPGSPAVPTSPASRGAPQPSLPPRPSPSPRATPASLMQPGPLPSPSVFFASMSFSSCLCVCGLVSCVQGPGPRGPCHASWSSATAGGRIPGRGWVQDCLAWGALSEGQEPRQRCSRAYTTAAQPRGGEWGCPGLLPSTCSDLRVYQLAFPRETEPISLFSGIGSCDYGALASPKKP